MSCDLSSPFCALRLAVPSATRAAHYDARTATLYMLCTGASAQVASEDFGVTNTDDWGIEFDPNLVGVHMGTGGNPGGRIEVTVQSSSFVAPPLPSNYNHHTSCGCQSTI